MQMDQKINDLSEQQKEENPCVLNPYEVCMSSLSINNFACIFYVWFWLHFALKNDSHNLFDESIFFHKTVPQSC